MKKFGIRRCRSIFLIAVIVIVFLMINRMMTISLRNSAFMNGWLLLLMVLILTGYNLRKKFPFLPLGSSSTWLQIHIYLGLFAIVVFGTHVGWQSPDGVLDSILSILFVLVSGSGVVGLVLSRVFARRITDRGSEVLFERIPRLRHRFRRDVERLVFDCVGETESQAVAEFYVGRLESFFRAPRNFCWHFIQSRRPRRALMTDIEALHRILNEQEKQFVQRITRYVEAKDDLDYDFAHQATLKYWLFLHIPLTYSLLVFCVLHLLVVYAFGGSP